MSRRRTKLSTPDPYHDEDGLPSPDLEPGYRLDLESGWVTTAIAIATVATLVFVLAYVGWAADPSWPVIIVCALVVGAGTVEMADRVRSRLRWW